MSIHHTWATSYTRSPLSRLWSKQQLSDDDHNDDEDEDEDDDDDGDAAAAADDDDEDEDEDEDDDDDDGGGGEDDDSETAKACAGHWLITALSQLVTYLGRYTTGHTRP